MQKTSKSRNSKHAKTTKKRTKKVKKPEKRRKKSSKTPVKKQVIPERKPLKSETVSEKQTTSHLPENVISKSSTTRSKDSNVEQCINEVHVINSQPHHAHTQRGTTFSNNKEGIHAKDQKNDFQTSDEPEIDADQAEPKLNFMNASLMEKTTCCETSTKEASLCQIDTSPENDGICGKKAVVQGRIFGKHLDCLIDTGSQVNAISRNEVPAAILTRLGQTDVTIQSFSGNSPPILGTFATDVHIGNLKLSKCTFFVIDDNCRTIIGTPALKSNNVIINLGKGEISNDNGSCPFMYVEQKTIDLNYVEFQPTQPKKIPLALTSEEGVLVKARSTRFIRLKSRFKVETAGAYAITDTFDENLPYGVILGKSVSILSPKNPECLVRICNTNDVDISIPKNVRIATLHAVTIAEPHVIATPTMTSEEKNEKFLKVMHDIKIGSKDPIMRKKLSNVIKQYLAAFATDEETLGTTNVVEYDIDTGTHPPVAQQRYRCPYYLQDELKNIVQDNVKKGLMEPCSSPWAAPVLLVKKKNGSWRLVCDYRRLNEVTTSDCYPLPRIDDLVTNLSKSRVFSAADLWTGFHQIPCSERAKEKLAITTEFGQFTWRNMPMGGKNAPSVFQRLMDQIFRTIPRSELVVYLDDLLCHSQTEAQNVDQLEQILAILVKNNLKIRAKKTDFLMRSIKFCGYIIENKTKRPNPEKVEAVRELSSPTNKQSAQQIFGLLNYHRDFIRNFAEKAAPITSTYRRKFAWTKSATNALNLLKTEISDKALSLQIPDHRESHFVVETDASNLGIGACLYICTAKSKDFSSNEPSRHAVLTEKRKVKVDDKQPGVDSKEDHKHSRQCLRPVEYMSKTLNEAQEKYTTMEKELFAAREAFRRWSHFLLGRKFTWLTDNTALAWAHKLRGRKIRISQWLSEISEFDIEVQRQTSASMKISDCLSRNFAEINTLRISRSNLSDLQENDAVLQNIRRYVSNQRWPLNPTAKEKSFAAHRENLHFGPAGELIYKDYICVKTIPPESLWSDLLAAYHDLNGHPGEKVTIEQLERKYFWPGLQHVVKDHIRTCHECQVTKPNLKPKKAPQGESETPTGPWEILAWDLIGPLEATDNNNRYILTGFDLFSKRAYAFAIPSKHSQAVTDHIETAILNNPRVPKKMLTDHGLEFADLKNMCEDLHIQHVKSPPYHPQANGAVERLNQTLKNRLFAIESSNWDQRLTRIIHAINCSKHAVTGVSPFLIENGRSGENVNDFLNHSLPPRINMQRIDEQTRSKILTEKAIRAEKFKNEDYLPFEIGDQVLIKNMTAKFPRFLGPYRVVSKRGPQLSYEVSNDFGQRFIRHVSHLKQYKSRDQPDCRIPESVSDDNPSENLDDKLNSPRIPEPDNGAKQQTSEFLFGSSGFYQAGFILKPLRPLKASKKLSNDESTNEEQVVENSPRRSQDENALISSTIDNANLNDNENPSSSDSELSVLSRSDLQETPKNQVQIENDQAIPELSQQVDENTTTGLDESQANTDCNQTPVLPRTFSLRDRSKIRYPSRPLDNNFEYQPSCSTPKARNIDESSDCPEDIFSTPKGTSIVHDTSATEDSPNVRERHVLNKTHTCPEPPNENGKKTLLSKFTKPQLIALATKLHLKPDGSCKQLMETIDHYFQINHPTWPRNAKGVLIITKYFKITEQTPLVQLTKDQLKDVYDHFGLEAPSSIKPKHMFLSQLEQQLRELFPDGGTDQNGSFILTPEILKTKPQK